MKKAVPLKNQVFDYLEMQRKTTVEALSQAAPPGTFTGDNHMGGAARGRPRQAARPPGTRGEEARAGLRWPARPTLVWEAAGGAEGTAEASRRPEDLGSRRRWSFETAQTQHRAAFVMRAWGAPHGQRRPDLGAIVVSGGGVWHARGQPAATAFHPPHLGSENSSWVGTARARSTPGAELRPGLHPRDASSHPFAVPRESLQKNPVNTGPWHRPVL